MTSGELTMPSIIPKPAILLNLSDEATQRREFEGTTNVSAVSANGRYVKDLNETSDLSFDHPTPPTAVRRYSIVKLRLL
jgi:hypothetical protein